LPNSHDAIRVFLSFSRRSILRPRAVARYASYTLALATQPFSDVIVALGGAAANLTTDPSMLQFRFNASGGDWAVPRTVTLAIDDDLIAQGDRSFVVTHTAATLANGPAADGTNTRRDTNYDGLALGTVTLAITDDDFAAVSLSSTQLTVGAHEGTGEALFSDVTSLALASQPAADVTVAFAAPAAQEDHVTYEPASFVFTSANWATAQARRPSSVVSFPSSVACG
jgi:hypothetical protein